MGRGRTGLLFAVLALLAGLGGCGLLGGGPQAAATPDVLRPGDALRIMVLGEDELTGTFVVDQDRTVHLPLVGAVPAGGLSLVRFENDLRAVLQQGYLKDPQILVARADPEPPPPVPALPVSQPEVPQPAAPPALPGPPPGSMTPAPSAATPPPPGPTPTLRQSQLSP
ncbi:MAG TPA: polysaccharide biosynthesis/export family protein [Rhizomicrobium sp.]|nr:polysaccharide biosynthesis/export family protein [Rhizomicrobium sp.]